MPESAVCGIVLAGGKGERLGGGRAKALRLLGGMRILEHAVRVVGHRATMVFVAAPVGLYLRPGRYERIADLAGGEGPLAGLVPSIEAAAARGLARAWTLAVDLPWVAPLHLDRLLRAL